MMRLKGFLSLLFFMLTQIASAQQVFNSVETVFNGKGGDESIAKEAFYKKITPGTQKQIQDFILHTLYAKGFIAARIDSSEADSNKLKVWVFTGQKYIWHSLDFSPEAKAALSEKGFRQEKLSDVGFSTARLNVLFDLVLSYYENRGYPFAAVKLDSIKIEDNKIRALMSVDKKEPVVIDTVLINGTADISPYFIYNLTGIRPGDNYNEAKVAALSKNINNPEFLSMKKAPEIMFGKGTALVKLTVNNNKSNTFDGIVGFYTDAQTGKLAVNGNFKLKLTNSLKSGETFKINWQRPTTGNQSLNIFYSQPYLFKSRFGIDYTFDLYRQDSSFMNISNKPLAAYRFTPDNFISAQATFFTSQLVAGNKDSTRQEFSSNTFGVGFGYAALDYRVNPRKGYAVKGSVEAGNKKTNGDEQNRTQGIKPARALGNFNAEWFIPLFKNSTMRLLNSTAVLLSQEIYNNELFRIGGFKSLRGFDEQSIWCSSYSVFDIEYRFLFARNSNLTLFYNFAYTEKKTTAGFSSDWPMGFGAGMNFDTGAGIMSIFYAIGRQQNNSLRFGNSKIHFGYSVKF